jgi:alkylation response protein AidB-like acyl-CoA dehydrogenase
VKPFSYPLKFLSYGSGSDVAGLQTTAVRDGDEWVISGTKKWITNGTFADYFSTGCRTEVMRLLVPTIL